MFSGIAGGDIWVLLKAEEVAALVTRALSEAVLGTGVLVHTVYLRGRPRGPWSRSEGVRLAGENRQQEAC